MPAHIPNVPLLKKPPIWLSKVSGDMLLGKVKEVSRIGLDKVHCLHVLVPEYRFFEFTQVFYRTQSLHWTLDPKKEGKLGDVVLIRKVKEEEQFVSTVPYILDRVVFEYGNFVDPINKRRNYHEGVYEDEVKFRKQIVDEVLNEPMSDIYITNEKRRQLVKQNIMRRRHRLSGKKDNNDYPVNVDS